MNYANLKYQIPGYIYILKYHTVHTKNACYFIASPNSFKNACQIKTKFDYKKKTNLKYLISTGHASFASFVELWTLLHPCPYCRKNQRGGVHWQLHLPYILGRIWHIGRLMVHHSYNRQLEHGVSRWSNLMDFLAQVPQSPRDQGPENAEKPKMQGKKLLSMFNSLQLH